MKPVEWVNKLMERHGLQKPDGRPLYQYRILDNEYQELLRMLRLSSNLGFQNISGQMLLWDAVMVFYASEWWRRHYIGQWGWEGIFDSIGLTWDDITTGRRNSLVEIGLRRWGRDVRERDGRRQFLGSVATEGGLPLNQLAESGGWLKWVLGPVVKKHIARNLPVEALIEAYESNIPRSYRSPEIKQVLEDIVLSVVALRSTHQLQNKDTPLDWLDANVEEWWNDFPLPVDNDIARSLLRELIVIAGDTPVTERANPFILERYLINANHAPELHAKLEMPRYVSCEDLPQLEFSSLPGRFELVVTDDIGKNYPWCRAIQTEYNGKKALRLSGRSLKFGNDSAISNLKLLFKSVGEVIAEVPIIEAMSMEKDIPWVFRKNENHWQLHGVATQLVSDEQAMVYIPARFDIENKSETTQCIATKEFLDGQLYSLEGKVLCGSGVEKYRLETSAQDSFTRYFFTGRSFDGVAKPADIYIGIPTLNEFNALTGINSRSKNLRLVAKPIGVDTSWTPLAEVGTGYFEVRLNDGDGNIRWRRRIGILDERFAFKVCPDRNSPLFGTIEIEGCCENLLSANVENTSVQIEQGNGKYVIKLAAKDSPPMFAGLSILPKGHKRELNINLPFPSIGALLFNPEGRRLSFYTPLYLNSLHGYRIKIFDERLIGRKEAHLHFSLLDPKMSKNDIKDMYVAKTINISSQVTELAIIDWHKIIQELISASGNLDSKVRVSIVISGKEMFRLDIKRYEHELNPDWDTGVVQLSKDDLSEMDVNELNAIQIQAISLQQPEQKPFMLPAERSEECHLGYWEFQPNKKDDGAWLIIPSIESPVQFRPLLWVVNNDESTDSLVFSEGVYTLQQAMRILDKEAREEALRLVMHQMSYDLEHKSWEYLNNLWDVTCHLPLATFDIWRLSVSEPAFLATLLVQGYAEVVERLEQELPIIWELVRIKDWFNALNAFKNSYEERLLGENKALEEDEVEILNSVLTKRINAVGNVSFTMKNMGAILFNLLLGKKSKELEVMQLPIDMIVKPRIDQALQNMLRSNSERQWPELLGEQIRSIFLELPGDIKELIKVHQDFKKVAAYLPIILAWRTNTDADYGWLGREVNIFKLEQIRNFDEEWFSIAFEDLSVWLSQSELITKSEMV